MLNRIILMGRLTRDPELRRTQTGTPVASFSLAVDRDFKDRNTGERTTDFIDCVAWRQTGEFVSRYFTKGRMAIVEGRLQIRDWTATSAAAPRWWLTRSISATPSGTARTAVIPPATASSRAAMPPAIPATPRPPHPPAMGPLPRTGTSLPSFLMTTASCRFDFDRIWS